MSARLEKARRRAHRKAKAPRAAAEFPPVMRMSVRDFEAQTNHEGVCTGCRRRDVLGFITLLTTPPAALCDTCLQSRGSGTLQ